MGEWFFLPSSWHLSEKGPVKFYETLFRQRETPPCLINKDTHGVSYNPLPTGHFQ